MTKHPPAGLNNPQFIVAYIMSHSKIEESTDGTFGTCHTTDDVKRLPLRYLGTEVVLKSYTIAEMAEQCHLTPLTFKRKFTKEYGEPPHQWLTRQRLGHASRLLIHSSLSIKEICYRCDFSSPSNFSRAFKSAYHCTPEEYRARDWGSLPISRIDVKFTMVNGGKRPHSDDLTTLAPLSIVARTIPHPTSPTEDK